MAAQKPIIERIKNLRCWQARGESLPESTPFTDYIDCSPMGEFVSELLDDRGLTIPEAEKMLRLESGELAQLIRNETGITPLLAYKLEAAFNITAENWIMLQAEHDLGRVFDEADYNAIRAAFDAN